MYLAIIGHLVLQGSLEQLLLGVGDVRVLGRRVVHQQHPQENEGHPGSAEGVEHGLPAVGGYEQPGERHREHRPDLGTYTCEQSN